MRCYNGAPDSDLRRVLEEREAARSRIQALGYSVTYFPNGEFYQAFDSRHLPVSGEHPTLFHVEAELRAGGQ